MNILITGSQGFIASNLALKLNKNKHNIYGIGRGKSKKYQFNDSGYKKNIQGDINPKNLKKIEKINFNLIIHCAGKVIGLEPTDDFVRNVFTMHYICNFASTQKFKPKIIFLSTVAVYGNAKVTKLNEKTKINPISNYALNKLLCEKILKFYQHKYKKGVCVLRVGSVFGPGLKRQFIYDACRKISEGTRIFFGTGYEKRDWLYIDDLISLINKIALKKDNSYEVFNVGCGKGIMISNVINEICQLMKINIDPTFNKKGVDQNPKILISNIKKLKKFNWKPLIDFNSGLKKYVTWFLNERN